MTPLKIDVLNTGFCSHPQIMTQKGGSLALQQYPSLIALITHPTEGHFLFDTGYDPEFLKATRPFPEHLYRWATPITASKETSAAWQLKLRGIACEDIEGIFISHFHGDHVSGLKNFPNATLYCARSGLEDIKQKSRFAGVTKGLLKALIPDDIERRAVYLEDCHVVSLPNFFMPFEMGADILGDGSMMAVPLPGHCVGHWGLITKRNNGDYIYFTADAAWSLAAIENNIPPPKITTQLLGKTVPYRDTLHGLYKLSQAGAPIKIVPSHCRDASERAGLIAKEEPE